MNGLKQASNITAAVVTRRDSVHVMPQIQLNAPPWVILPPPSNLITPPWAFLPRFLTGTQLYQQPSVLVHVPEVKHRMTNDELLKRYGFVDCHVSIEPLENVEEEDIVEEEEEDYEVVEEGDEVIFVGEIFPAIQPQRKRKAIREPTYHPSRRLRRQSIGWAETRVLRNLPMREITNLRDDIEIINEWEAED